MPVESDTDTSLRQTQHYHRMGPGGWCIHRRVVGIAVRQLRSPLRSDPGTSP